MRYARPKVLPLDPSRRRRARRLPKALGLAAACVVVFGATVTAGLAWPQLQAEVSGVQAPAVQLQTDAPGVQAPDVQFGEGRIVRVVDGDTVVMADGEHVRILNIDTAEMPPRSQCDGEARLALAAKARLGEIVRGSSSVVLSSDGGRDRDRYGRQLRLIRIDGQDVGEALIREGLAQRWRGHKATWC